MPAINWDEAKTQVGGDMDFLKEVLQDLINEADSSNDEMSQGISKRDPEVVRKAAHRVKGSASYLSCEELRDISKNLQDVSHTLEKGEGGSWEEIIDLYNSYANALEALKAEISAEFGI